ncbi:hypothetical protein CEQ90_14505 [Lewinellaceae bacterium SD302]|nr:hypothetical protein CEQ90_14505 [Lewinellaceae bacterium SD302]
MEWSYNQLQSVGKNGVLITHGDNDTYATLLLQAVHEVRPDVSVVNLPLLANFPTYRKRIVNELNLATPTEDQLLYSDLLEIITAGPRPVYLGVGAHDNLVAEQAHKLYLTGLTFRYAADSFNNLLPLVHNYRDQWRQNDLFAPLGTGPRQAVADQLNQNYLPALLELREYYQIQDPGEAKRLEVAVRRIANRSGLEDRIEEFLAPPPHNIASENVALKARQIAKNFREIPAGNYQYQLDEKGNFISTFPIRKEGIKTIKLSGFWLQETEVSNADYQLFLEDLLRQRYFDLLDTVAIAEADYNQFLPEGQRDPSINSLYRERVELLHNHPVTSISHRAAELYATWLTEVYNQDPKRKDQVTVRFRLPTADEIAYAARGGRKYSPYPWGGPSVANAKGCFLANFNTSLIEHPINGKSLWDMVDKEKALRNPSSEPGCDFASDGGLLTVPVDAYFPNDYGIYNLSGNAAEMTSQDGVDVGGSWADHALDMEIGRRQKRTTPHPAVGFRLVMEYVD